MAGPLALRCVRFPNTNKSTVLYLYSSTVCTTKVLATVPGVVQLWYRITQCGTVPTVMAVTAVYRAGETTFVAQNDVK